jgi:hypothetical protein
VPSFFSSVLTAPDVLPLQPLASGFFFSTTLPASVLPLQPAAAGPGTIRPAPVMSPAMLKPASTFFRYFFSTLHLHKVKVDRMNDGPQQMKTVKGIKVSVKTFTVKIY